MATCPVCEHVQESGDTCDVCGKTWGTTPIVAAAVATVPGLEQTVWEEPFPEDPPAMADLEQTALAPTPLVPEGEAVADLEATALPGAGADVGATPLIEDIDRGRAPEDLERVELSTGPVTCRYCKSVQTEGVYCDRCGMRLPRSAGAVGAPVAAPARRSQTQMERCRRCGEKVELETRCRSCGQLAAALDA